MLADIKNRIEQELPRFISRLDKAHSLTRISPILFKSIREFISREGKRIRPSLFIIGYLGYAKKQAPDLYTSALSIEFLHDFMLVHDDIIDKSEMRRGKPSMHVLFNSYLKRYAHIKFNGEDLTIVAGDVMFAMALHAFLAIKEERQRKERALKKLLEAAHYTGSGEFIELLCGTKDMKDVTQQEIYRIYDFKTAHYTIASPLAIGATLAGAQDGQVERLMRYGLLLGRAFQIKDDILGMFSETEETGKSSLSDLQESKKTILMWYAYHHAKSIQQKLLRRILTQKRITHSDLHTVRVIIRQAGGLDYAEREIRRLAGQARAISHTLSIKPRYKNTIENFAQDIFDHS